jgi:hypothetical protein
MKLSKRQIKNSKKHKVVTFFTIATLLIIGGTVAYYSAGRLSHKDCTSYEKYDSLRGECYFECETDDECAEIAAKVDAELNKFFEGSKSKISNKKPETPPAPESSKPVEKSAQQPPSPAEAKAPTSKPNTTAAAPKTYTSDETGSETNGKIYTVTTDQQLYPKPSDGDNKLWELFRSIATNQTIKDRLETFEVFNDASNDSAASVWESSTPGKWHMNVNAAFADDRKDLIHTMVHEYGHIVTLDTTQVDKTNGACPVLTVPEGCVKSGSVLAEFHNAFWAGYSSTDGADYSADRFVSEYAASNTVEDLAETFAYFVLRPKPEGTAIKDQKIQKLYSFQNLVNIRNRIRATLAYGEFDYFSIN